MTEPKDDLLARIMACLDADPAIEPYGPAVSDAWGAARWLKITTEGGSQRYLRVAVEPYRPAD